jgi:DNA polymerase III alpha subunit (gram-positive type)
MSKIMYLDIETTGFDSNNDHIVQFASIIEENGNVVDEFDVYIKPLSFPFDYNLSAGKVTGLTKEFLLLNGVSKQEFYNMFLELAKKHIKINSKNNKWFMSGKNVGFDRAFLEVFFNSMEDSIQKYFMPLNIDIDCEIVSNVVEGKLKVDNYKLETVAAAVGISLNNSHNAIDDIKATRDIYKKLRKMK